ncbi:MAG: phosphatidate cytidylyltransferase [Anaerolineae bacterium]
MIRKRVLTAVVALPLVIAATILGGLWFFGLILALLTVAAIEFCALMKRGVFSPAPLFTVALLWVLLIDAQFPAWRPFGYRILEPGVSLVLMVSVAWQLAHREGFPTADWALTVAGGLYLGWLGAHMLRLRSEPAGLWWVLTAIPAIMIADGAAYTIGRRWGRHRMSPTVSPGKTWEGFSAGIVVGSIATAGLATLWDRFAGPAGPDWLAGLVIGAAVSLLAPVGDLVISMMKRDAEAKDSGTLFPGHGGALDRLDSILWAGVIGYYLTLLLR